MNEFRAAVETQDLERLVALLDEDVVFRSPVVFKPYRGRDQVAVVLAAVARVFEDFRYEREIGAAGASDHALVFTARVGDRELEGCDFLHTNDAGLIDELVVMVRPLSAALALVEGMKAELARAETEAGGHRRFRAHNS
jgi:SnoaL-like domain